MAKQKEKQILSEQEIEYMQKLKRAIITEPNMRKIDIWGLSHVFVPILMQPENTITTLRRLLAIVEYPHDLVDMEDHVISIQKDMTIKFKMSWQTLDLLLVFEKMIGERVFLEDGKVKIGTFFKEDFEKILHLHL
jgi:hypothetical protein